MGSRVELLPIELGLYVIAGPQADRVQISTRTIPGSLHFSHSVMNIISNFIEVWCLQPYPHMYTRMYLKSKLSEEKQVRPQRQT